MAIIVIVSSSIGTSLIAGNSIRPVLEKALFQQATRSIQQISQSFADIISKRFDTLLTSASIIAEVTADRIVGDNWENDSAIPFIDMLSNTPMFPLANVSLPPDWDLEKNVNEKNFPEHIQNMRKDWYDYDELSTAHASFRFQGQCDPSAKEGKSYFLNCTEENNNVETCGNVKPIRSRLHEKVGFLQYVLKPIFEADQSIRLLGVYFFNKGAGASVVYPSYVLDGTASYRSIGCDWMRQENPNTGEPFATNEEIERCHKPGEVVSGREYNAFEREWCRDQVLQGNEPFISSPYQDVFQKDLRLITFGQAVFDRLSGELIACTLVDVALEYLKFFLSEVFTEEILDVALVDWQSNDIIAALGVNRTDPYLKATYVSMTETDYKTIKKSIIGEDVVKENVFFRDEERSVIAGHVIPTLSNDSLEIDNPYALFIMMIRFDPFERIQKEGNDVISSLKLDLFQVLILSAFLGGAGLFITLLFTWIVAHFLTKPLEWIESASKQIINSDQVEHDGKEPFMKYTPKTEITTLVSGFRRMIKNFSGNRPAQVAQSTLHEIPNIYKWSNEFKQLYSRTDEVQEHQKEPEMKVQRATPRAPRPRRQDGRRSFRASFIAVKEQLKGTSANDFTSNGTYGKEEDLVKEFIKLMNQNHTMKRVHFGRNLRSTEEQDYIHTEMQKSTRKSSGAYKSLLFWWIVILFIIPLLGTIVAVTHIILTKNLTTFPQLVEETAKISIMFEKVSIDRLVTVNTLFAAQLLQETIRDQHILKRFSEWLLLGTIERSSAFTDIQQAAEECKVFPKGNCTYLKDKEIFPCICEWRDKDDMICQINSNISSARYKQRRMWGSQKQDANLDTGNRNFTTYPSVDQSPGNTSWWADVENVPGSYKKLNVSGYETTYDRLRVLSPLSVVEFPIRNYHTAMKNKSKYLGIFVAFEADGMVTGTAGCDYSLAEMAHFRSTDENGAAIINPDLCPVGKYGFDARCRDWYASGRAVGKTYMTAPYKSMNGKFVASITSPIFDETNKEHIGQVLLDFSPDFFFNFLNEIKIGMRGTGFPILVTQSRGLLGGDSVVGPNISLSSSSNMHSPDIVELLLPKDTNDSAFYLGLTKIVKEMKEGKIGNASFFRTGHDGDPEELFISYQPIYAKILKGFNNSDFRRGVMENDTMIYSLAMGIPTADLFDEFDGVDDSVQEKLSVLKMVLLSVTIITSITVVILVSIVAISVTRPVIILCNIVKSINEGNIQQDPPPMKGGSREFNQVYNSFSKLYKIVRFSNSAFFSGNLPWALKFLTDALKLFRNMKDNKAIGVVLNNLGNIYFSFYLSKKHGENCFHVDGKCVKCSAHKCYDDSIEMAVTDYELIVNDDSVSDETKAQYACLLANRYFNRGIFLLMTVSDPCSPESQNESAVQDLALAAKLDTELRNYWMKTRQIKLNSEHYFERLILRSRGLVAALEGGFGDVETLLFEADSLLCSMGKDDRAPLITKISHCGRLQQLEEIAIRMQLKQGKVQEAASLAARMMIEDEYILESAFASAAEAILQCMQPGRCNKLRWSPKTIETTKNDMRQMLKSCKSQQSLQSLEKTVIFCYGLSMPPELLDATKNGVVHLLTAVCQDEDKLGLEVFDDTSSEGQNFHLAQKKGISSNGLKDLSASIKSASFKASQNPSDQCLVDSVDIMELDTVGNETWLILTLSRSSYDGWDAVKKKWLRFIRKENVHIIVIGVDLNESMLSRMRPLCRPRGSTFIEARSKNSSIAEAFADAANMISGGVDLKCFTMEKF